MIKRTVKISQKPFRTSGSYWMDDPSFDYNNWKEVIDDFNYDSIFDFERVVMETQQQPLSQVIINKSV